MMAAEVVNCRRCQVPMRWGKFICQTVNRLRPGQMVGSLYPCGPGVLTTCLKCPRCGHSITADPTKEGDGYECVR